MAFLLIRKTFDIKKGGFFLIMILIPVIKKGFFFNNDINTCYKKVLVTTLSLFIIAPLTFLVVLVLFINLVDRKLLLLTKYVNRRGVSKLIFPQILILFFC